MLTNSKMWVLLLKKHGTDPKHLFRAARWAQRYWESSGAPSVYEAVNFGHQLATQRGWST